MFLAGSLASQPLQVFCRRFSVAIGRFGFRQQVGDRVVARVAGQRFPEPVSCLIRVALLQQGLCQRHLVGDAPGIGRQKFLQHVYGTGRVVVTQVGDGKTVTDGVGFLGV